MPLLGALMGGLSARVKDVNRETRAYGAFETKARRKPGQGVKYD